MPFPPHPLRDAKAEFEGATDAELGDPARMSPEQTQAWIRERKQAD